MQERSACRFRQLGKTRPVRPVAQTGAIPHERHAALHEQAGELFGIVHRRSARLGLGQREQERQAGGQDRG